MKKLFLYGAMALVAGSFFAAAQNVDGNKTLMSVGGHDVTVGEFLYLYNKNNSQQLQSQSIGDYVGMFVDYKLKVADAQAAGLDTTAAFVAEYEKFRNELATPYLKDSAVEDALVDEAYSHALADVNVSHIMIPANRSLGTDAAAYARLDSLRKEIVSGNVTFEDAARVFSVDAPTAERGGLMGWLPVSRYPWAFEKASYDTPVGGVSPVIDSGFGLHLVKVNDRRPSAGEVHAAHILKLTRDVPADRIPVQKQAIDSIYQLLISGADFAEVARAESQDPGSAKKGGDLGWFGSRVMVPEFDSVAFALADGQLSEPFQTAFGYHIIKKFEHRDVESKDAMRDKLIASMSRDGRADEPRKAFLAKVGKRVGCTPMMANKMSLRHRLSNVPADSAVLAAVAVDPLPLVRIGDSCITVADAYARIASNRFPNGAVLVDALDRSADALADERLAAVATDELVANNDSYANLLNEYRDGILLFEISNRNVWDKASQDAEGLERFFEKNRSKYKWDSPRFKSYVFFAPDDSTLTAAVAYADSLDSGNQEEFVEKMRKEFGKNLKIERVIAAKGENAITDYLAFGGEKPDAKNPRWKAYAAYAGRVVAQPEGAADVKGAVTADYQALLEKQWLKQLHKRYPVKIDKKVLKEISNN